MTTSWCFRRSWAAIVGLMLLVMCQQQRQPVVMGFAAVRSSTNNITFTKYIVSNPLMLPLRLDAALKGSNTDIESGSPRGIVLNSGVGGFVFAGGLMGYIKAGSKASLMAGSTFGGMLLLSAYLISKAKDTKGKTGNVLGSIVAGLLTYAMGKKYLKAGKFMPSGFIASLGAVAFAYNAIESALLPKRSKKR